MGWLAGRSSDVHDLTAGLQGSWSRQTLTLALSSFPGLCHPRPLLNTGRSVFLPGSPARPRGASPSSLLCPSASFHDGLIAHSSSDAEQAPGGKGCRTGKAAPTPGFGMRAAWRHLQVHSQAPLWEGLWSRFHGATGHSHLRSESLSGAPRPSPHEPAGRGARDEPRFICESRTSHQRPCSCNFNLLMKSSTAPTGGGRGQPPRAP